jgi:16S rRNA U1498 N3-methylase RsmE
MAARKGDWRVQYGGWRGLSDDERDNFRRLGFIGVEIIENILKERNK